MLVLEAIVNRFTTMADGSGRLTMDTQILTPEQFSQVGAVNKKSGVLTFKAGVDQLTQKELDAIESVDIPSGLGDRKKKTPSQLLRQVLYRNWEKNNEGFEKQEAHYQHYMSVITEHFRDKLK